MSLSTMPLLIQDQSPLIILFMAILYGRALWSCRSKDATQRRTLMDAGELQWPGII